MTSSDLDDLYELLDELAKRIGGPRQLSGCTGHMHWPNRGVYFFFELGESRLSGSPRVVRVGTHALTTHSKTTLWQRLSQHKGSNSGQWAGGGNHRGSIFRLHVGAALLERDGGPENVARTWGIGNSASSDVRALEHQHECRVSQVIGAMPFLWVDVPDPPGPDSDRGIIEAGSIAHLSRRSNKLADPASSGWLGNSAQRDTIRTSSLWNVRHVDDPPSRNALDVLKDHVFKM